MLNTQTDEALSNTENIATEPLETGSILAAIFLALWVIVTAFIAQVGGWFAEQIVMISGAEWPWWRWSLISLAQAILLLIFILPFAWRWKNRAIKAVFQQWALATGFIILLIPVRFGTLPTAQRFLWLQFGLVALAGGGLFVYAWRRQQINLQISGTKFATTLAMALLLSYPWLAWGALGSPWEAILTLLSGLCFGATAATVLAYPGQRPSTLPAWLNGLLIGVTLLILSSGLNANGIQLLLMISLASLGWLLLGLGGHPNWLGTAIIVGWLTAVIQSFLDPDELVLILSVGGGEILGWAFTAAAVTVIIAWALGFIRYFARAWSGWQRRPLTGGLVAITALGAILLYSGYGQPGFHGDQLFVILKDQADLSQADTFTDIVQKRAFVYQTLVAHANQTQADLRTQLDQSNTPYQPYYLVNALNVEGGPQTRRWLADHPAVDRVLHNPILRPLPEPIPTAVGQAEPPTEPPWNLTLIGADRVWAEFGVRGDGVVIGQSDSGVDWYHRELQSSYRGALRAGGSEPYSIHDYDWLDPWNHTTEPVDIGGHGTHTLGSIVGQTVGVAPGATWYGCANLPRNLANPALYLDCMQFMLAPYPQQGNPFTDGDPERGADVLNNSWGCPDIEGCDAETLLAGAKALRNAGIFVVVSAGNEGPNCETIRDPLSLYDDVFSVGAVNEASEVAVFSSRGPVSADGSGRAKPDIVAPGQDILSAFPGNSYERADGTSMAGPHVAGVVALMWSANPGLIGQVDQTEAILRETATPIIAANGADLAACGDMANTAGQGLVNAYAAVQMALNQVTGDE